MLGAAQHEKTQGFIKWSLGRQGGGYKALTRINKLWASAVHKPPNPERTPIDSSPMKLWVVPRRLQTPTLSELTFAVLGKSALLFLVNQRSYRNKNF
jgi:hypothetical protein